MVMDPTKISEMWEGSYSLRDTDLPDLSGAHERFNLDYMLGYGKGPHSSEAEAMPEKDYVTGREMDAHLEAVNAKIDARFDKFEGILHSEVEALKTTNQRILEDNRSTRTTVITTVIAALGAFIAVTFGYFSLSDRYVDFRFDQVESAAQSDMGRLQETQARILERLEAISPTGGTPNSPDPASD